MTTIDDQLDHATRLRHAIDGDPAQGPYPATLSEVADEVAAWINRVDRTHVYGLRGAVISRLVRELQS